MSIPTAPLITDLKMENGFLYIAIGKRYLLEAQISARSLRRFTKHPICIITDEANFTSPLFDIIIHENMPADFVSKIIGIKKTPFQKTIYLDSDTFICAPIDQLFKILDLFDMAMTIDRYNHSYGFLQHYNASFQLKFENVLPEYHTGLIVYGDSQPVKGLINDWLELHQQMNVKADMPSFREAFIKNATTVRIAPLPFEYNYFGTLSFGFAYNEIKIFHERLGERWNTLTTLMLPFEKMDKKARMMNKYHYKRIIIPYFGVIPYRYSPYIIKHKLKRLLGIKKTKKAETF